VAEQRPVQTASVSSKQTSHGSDRRGLTRLLKAFSFVLIAAVLFVLFDFAFDWRPSTIQSSYRFNVGELAADEVKVLRHDNLSILVVRRSPQAIAHLQEATDQLQDPESDESRQPEYARNTLRSRHPQYFVSYALGTDLGCTLKVLQDSLQEICGRARYDLAGRALKGEHKFSNLSIPDYNFTNNFRTLTINP
jgi:ubiquinol-cytochrome c reductase iron-sulfur subunit